MFPNSYSPQLSWLGRTIVALSLSAFPVLPVAASTLHVKSFVIEATRPTAIGPRVDEPDFTGCKFEDFDDFPVPNPNAPDGLNVHDDGNAALRSVRDPEWWRPTLMTMAGNLGSEFANRGALHWDDGTGTSFPEILSFFQDGGFRPNPATNVPFTSTIRFGPLEFDAQRGRRFADVIAIDMMPNGQGLVVTYRNGESASVFVEEASPQKSRFRVEVDYAPNEAGLSFEVTSMFRDPLVNDVSLIETLGADGVMQTDPALAYPGGDVTEFLLFRDEFAAHNWPGPDIRLSDFTFVDDDGNAIAGAMRVINESHATSCAEEDNIVFTFAAVPEPTTLALLLAGLLTILAAARELGVNHAQLLAIPGGTGR